MAWGTFETSETIPDYNIKRLFNEVVNQNENIVSRYTSHIEFTANTATHQMGCGISLGIFFVRQGALNGDDQFLPNIPPMTVRGKPTRNRYTKMISTVLNP